VATLLARPFTRAADPMAGFFALPRPVYDRAESLNPIGYKIGLELMVKCRCERVHEVPIHFSDRVHGESKLSFKEQLLYVLHLKRLADFKYGMFSRLMQFCLVGATGMAVDLSAYYLLLTLGVWLPVGRAAAIWLAMTWNFLLNRLVTFEDRRSERVLVQYGCFVISCLAGALVNWGTSVSLTHFLAFFAEHKLLAAAVGIVLGTVSNFLLSYVWVFKPKPTEPDAPAG